MRACPLTRCLMTFNNLAIRGTVKAMFACNYNVRALDKPTVGQFSFSACIKSSLDVHTYVCTHAYMYVRRTTTEFKRAANGPPEMVPRSSLLFYARAFAPQL